jgi:surface antigen
MTTTRGGHLAAIRSIGVLALIATLTLTGVAQTCGPLTSAGNPYPCSNGGNCTFFTWHQGKYVWGQDLSFPNRSSYGLISRDAKNWATHARNHGFTVNSEPGSLTIAVTNSASFGSAGHVWWVDRLDWDRTRGREMNWGKWGISFPTQGRVFSQANQGYIYPQPMPGRPIVQMTVSPTLWAGPGDQTVWFSGSNFTPDMLVDVTFPNGSNRVTLQGTQVLYSSGSFFGIRVTLNARGWWKFRAVARNGQRTDPVWLYVN